MKGLSVQHPMVKLTFIVLFLIAYGPQGAVSVTTSSVSKSFLTFVEYQKNGVGGVEGLNGVWSVALSPDGKHVYAAAYRDDAVVVFKRDATTGKLTFVEVQKEGIGVTDGLSGVLSVIVSPDGKHVYAGAYWDEAVAVFSRDATTGKLTFLDIQKEGVGGIGGLNGIRSVTVSQDGSHIYTAGYRSQAVAIFSREETTGRLTFLGTSKRGEEGVAGLEGLTSVVVTKDGKHAYATGFIDGTVAVFRRDASTGKLIFVETQRDGVGGAEGLKGAFSVIVSPDSKNAYVAGFVDSSVAVFSRNGMTGGLTLVEVQRDGVGGVDGLEGNSSLALSADARHLYAAGYLDNAVAVFRRDASTGKLTFVEVQRDGVAGAHGLGGVRCVIASPDGSHIYLGGSSDKAMTVFGVR